MWLRGLVTSLTSHVNEGTSNLRPRGSIPRHGWSHVNHLTALVDAVTGYAPWTTADVIDLTGHVPE